MKNFMIALRQLPTFCPIFSVSIEVFEYNTGYSPYDNSWLTANPSGLMNSLGEAIGLEFDPNEFTTDNFSWNQTNDSRKICRRDEHNLFYQSDLVKLLKVPFVSRAHRAVAADQIYI